MVIPSFQFFGNRRLVFGEGKLAMLPDILASLGGKALIVTGAASLQHGTKWELLQEALRKKRIEYTTFSVSREPSPEMIDAAVARFRKDNLKAVVGLGGGSAVDAGKAISAMLPQEGFTEEYLEGVGVKEHNGRKVPFIAVPTTSGTGSEATKNAVLSRIYPSPSGKKGFKKSLRHDHLIPDVALLDPELTFSCPPQVTAACGMDALAQLLEAYLSPKASPLTDALALDGISALKDALIPAFSYGSQNLQVRSAMAYAAYLSGVVLANAGLGVIHGFASSIAAYFDIPHGVICGTLAGVCTAKNIEILKKKSGMLALEKYAKIGTLFAGKAGTMEENLDSLIRQIQLWTDALNLPALHTLGIQEGDIERLAEETEIKSNPVPLGKEDLKEILRRRW